MRKIYPLFVILLPCCLTSTGTAQSLGDVARQQRVAKSSAIATHRVITNEDISSGTQSGIAPELSQAKKETPQNNKLAPAAPKTSSAAELRERIKAQKEKVQALQVHIQEIQKKLDARDNIGNVTTSQRVWGADASRFTSYCSLAAADPSRRDWCDEPAKWNADLDKTKEKLQAEQSALEALQEQARQLGYGNSFYDPD